MHESLSQSLARILAGGSSGITLNRLLERTEGRGFYLVIILLAVSAMEEDDVTIWIAYAVSAGTIV